ncbi:hypothetical protein CJF42_25460 [Pseudoalteromonas sp. NBT06-2]|uniref:hypothetical protein n=1 Tax=Pseudoalteromonas sp. NBT06-2 TaxID=2025950 RepID=UPI000BA55018|nr:hypothetical protein [Pseudoalteromonas sp. NBT06-2]PAJ71672.1 hypothetical protein CJF42_25460 [Pseudoalteromonas sp. NBT06-2]
MKYLINLTIIILTLTFGISAQAATITATGKVSMMRHYGSGMMLVYGLTFDGQTSLAHCNGTKTGFLIPNEYEKIDRLLSLLLTAKATGVTVTVRGLDVGSSCWAPTFVGSSYIDFN